ncbi:DUF5357 domain-containing protein [bacterium]|nr:DUF5357 domain-containing protein [bacterium]
MLAVALPEQRSNEDPVFSIFSIAGSVCLIFGAKSWMNDNKVKFWIVDVGSYVCAALLCVLIFQYIEPPFPSAPYLLWIVLAGFIVVYSESPEFVSFWQKASLKIRGRILVLALIHLLIACWIQFHFLTKSWIEQYSGILEDDLSNSAFVIRTDIPRWERFAPGKAIVDKMEQIMSQNIQGRSWADGESWLRNVRDGVINLEQEVLAALPEIPAESNWSAKLEILPQFPGYEDIQLRPEYKVELRAYWRGLSSSPTGYYLGRSCLVESVQNNFDLPGSPRSLTQVLCEANVDHLAIPTEIESARG